MASRTQLTSSDLFVVLERAFRRRAPECDGCTFSVPYSQHYRGDLAQDWTITLTNNCSPRCLAILEELLSKYRREYALAAAS
jgi:hypothetical protein